jgi:hypothetical protein
MSTSPLNDPNSPAAGEGGEHTDLFVAVQGMYDVGTLELKGWTLISNNDLALLKAGIDPAPKPKLERAQVTVLRRLINRYANSAVEAAFAGTQSSDDAAQLRKKAQSARMALDAYINGLLS